jgi:23S rRNA (cytosine1962-C5)-methyltransferase
LGQYQKFDQVQHEFEVEENGLKFIVNLSDYLDTGLFLDHRVTRQMVREEAAGKKVLNLFAYTGSFSVYAAAGKAVQVVTVDLSNTYLQWAERNYKLNDFAVSDLSAGKGGVFLQKDVKQYLRDIPAGYFDLVVMDPPTFSNSKRMDEFLDIQKDHVTLINQCLHTLKEGGVLYFSTNSRTFILNEEEIKASSIKDITKATTPFDFEGRLFRWCFKLVK